MAVIDNIGEVFETNNFGELKVLKLAGKTRWHEKIFEVEFLETGYRTEAVWGRIKHGSVRDRLAKTHCGVGMLGEAYTDENRKAYKVWRGMIERCYSDKTHSYKTYGAEGITVCERWHRFDYFLEDLPDIFRYDKDKFENGEIVLDKDLMQKDTPKNEMVYSPETCVFIEGGKNSVIKDGKYLSFKATDPKGKVYYSYSQTKFAKEHNLKRQSINSVLNGWSQTHKGWKFEFINRDIKAR